MNKKPDTYFKDLFLSVYNKNKLDLARVDRSMMIGLSRWLSNDPLNLKWLSRILEYQFYIDPKHYFYLLYFGIRKEYMKYPYGTAKKQKKEDDIFLDRLKEIFNWSEKELEYNRPLLKFLNLRKDWARKVGLDK